MNAELHPTRNPTVEEWYGKSYVPTFPDDDGEETRRLSTLRPVTMTELAARWNAHDELVAALTKLLACPAIADVDHNDPEWGDGETAAAETIARAALSKASANSIEEVVK